MDIYYVWNQKDVLKGRLKWGMGPKAMKSTINKFGLENYVNHGILLVIVLVNIS